ncbi:MAG: WcaF family extracellular polysaccharide biosynthesis acetyltransferase [Candidatus Symbiothrix sp.]|jgi:putative colanic acid biosynthesis acetyltransferase WcaF|nr:WcaF family extracellular polysaccharide biosynthesis acetyltransferase [Candidatus Symbiothrix sp.]
MKTVDLSLFDNSWWKPGNKLKLVVWYFINVLFFINPLNPISGLKVWLLRLFGAKIGKHVLIKPAVNIKYPWLLEVGDYVWIGDYVWLQNSFKLTIGNNVCISQGVMVSCGNHDYRTPGMDLVAGEITIEDGVWLGAKSLVSSGLTDIVIQSGTVLSAGSVATKNLDAWTVYVGNPAQAIKTRVIQ